MLPTPAVPHGFFAEGGHYEFLLSLDGLPPSSDMTVLVNDVPRDRLVRGGTAFFPYDTEFSAGGIRVEVVRAGRVAAAAEVAVDPAAAKLTRDEYAAMISEISDATLALYRLGGATVPAAVGPFGRRSDVVTLDLVGSNIGAFERAVGRIADSPLRVLRSIGAEASVERARRLDDRAIEGALRGRHARAASEAEALSAPTLVAALRGTWISRVADRRTEERLDTYEHRATLGFLRWLDAALGGIARRLAATSAAGDLAPAAVARAARVALWRGRLAGLARRSLFAQLQPDPHLRPTSAFRMRSDYAAAFAAMARMRAGLGGSAAAAPSVPLEQTFVLYEIWCCVLLLRAAAQRYPTSQAAVAALLRGCASPGELGVRLLQGADAAIPLGPSLRLTYQRRFSPTPDAGGARTLAVEAVPDITLERLAPDGRTAGVVVLDPKYRVGASLLDGIRNLHFYRDAIVGADGRRIVRAAVVLAPRASFSPALAGPLPRHAPGVAVVRPGHDPEMFGRLLEAAVNALQDGAETALDAA